VLGEAVDALGQQRDLHLGRPGIVACSLMLLTLRFLRTCNAIRIVSTVKRAILTDYQPVAWLQ